MIIPFPKQNTSPAELEFRASEWGAAHRYTQSAGNWVYDADGCIVGPDWLYVYTDNRAEIDLWWQEQQQVTVTP